MLFTVAIAVCMSATPIERCGDRTAIAWIVAPEQPASPGGCMIHGMQYAASSNLVTQGSYAKVFCTAGPPAETTPTPLRRAAAAE
jgi:hypothetical protein